jgi:glycosyltransferase involved in cell wall biosynthesis
VKKITFLGPAWPYRGGIATIIERLAAEFAARGAEVDIKTFSMQYPAWLFPGKSQFRGGEPPEGLRIARCVNTMNPFNWLRVGLAIRRERPDAVVLKYWTPLMAPCFGTIARVAKLRRGRKGREDGNGGTRFLVQLDNVIPHEHRWFDRLLTRYFVRSMDGFIAMSGQVERELARFTSFSSSRLGNPSKLACSRSQRRFDTVKPRLLSPHPVFDHFGEPLAREEAARRLGLDPEARHLLFFGLVRAYKGLDMLIEAFARLKGMIAAEAAAPGTGAGMSDGTAEAPAVPDNLKLIIAGEFYDDVAQYRAQIERLGIADDVALYDRFVHDDEIPAFFSLADLLVLPYRTATQSGVTQIAMHFDVPMVVTDVGGLPEVVRDGVTGYVCPPEPAAIAAAIERFYAPGNAAALRAAFPEEKKRFSWAAAADAIEELLVISYQ